MHFIAKKGLISSMHFYCSPVTVYVRVKPQSTRYGWNPSSGKGFIVVKSDREPTKEVYHTEFLHFPCTSKLGICYSFAGQGSS